MVEWSIVTRCYILAPSNRCLLEKPRYEKPAVVEGAGSFHLKLHAFGLGILSLMALRAGATSGLGGDSKSTGICTDPL